VCVCVCAEQQIYYVYMHIDPACRVQHTAFDGRIPS
jgi:hypothetical protein